MVGLKTNISKEKLRFLIIFILLSASLFLQYYFQFILKISIIFSHFFYIPIIFACLWWKNKGLVVPIFLSGLLIFFPILSGMDMFFNNLIENIFRAVLILFIGIVVVILSKQILKAENKLKERVKELNCLFNIIELIKNPNISIEEILIETQKQIQNAWKFPDMICSRIVFDKKEYLTDNYKKTPWKLTVKNLIKDKELSISVHYLEEKPFLEEEKNLLEKIAEQLKAIFEFKLLM